MPYLRGYAPTPFRSADPFRNGQQAALAQTTSSHLMDALKIPTGGHRRVRLGGAHRRYRCGAVAATHSSALVSVSGYLDRVWTPTSDLSALRPSSAGGISTISRPTADRSATGRTPHDFNKLIWQGASPIWHFDDATYRPHRRGIRQSRPCRDRHPQLPLAPQASLGASRGTTTSTRTCCQP